jgi:SAM-dependent methyltransferase
VDWPSERVQLVRFRELCRLLPEPGTPFSILDYGCGYGALLAYLRAGGWNADYTGFDVADAMIALARSQADEAARFITSREQLDGHGYDYVVASGIFNVKLEAPEANWDELMLDTIAQFDALSRRGFAFNALSSRREPHRKMPHLAYADPARLLALCLERYSPEVALLHDYGLWDFTLIVRK